MIVELFAPDGYWKIPEAERVLRNTACGAGSGIGDLVVPDSVFGIRVTEVCRIHDYMYSVGETEEDRLIADRVMLNNLLRVVEEAKSKCKIPVWCTFLATIRRYRAMTYYTAVRNFGGPAFWKEKNSPSEINGVLIDSDYL